MRLLVISGEKVLTNESKEDFRKIIREKLGQDAETWFDSILSEETAEASKIDWEEEAHEKECIAEYYSNALQDVLNIAQDLTMSNRMKLDKIECFINKTI